MSGQSITDRIAAAQHSMTGSAISKAVCKATTHEVSGPKKKHLDCECVLAYPPLHVVCQPKQDAPVCFGAAMPAFLHSNPAGWTASPSPLRGRVRSGRLHLDIFFYALHTHDQSSVKYANEWQKLADPYHYLSSVCFNLGLSGRRTSSDHLLTSLNLISVL